jgi:hypothetical protein
MFFEKGERPSTVKERSVEIEKFEFSEGLDESLRNLKCFILEKMIGKSECTFVVMGKSRSVANIFLLFLAEDETLDPQLRQSLKRPIRLSSSENMGMYSSTRREIPDRVLARSGKGKVIFFFDDSAKFLQKARLILRTCEKYEDLEAYSLLVSGPANSRDFVSKLGDLGAGKICIGSDKRTFHFVISDLAEERSYEEGPFGEGTTFSLETMKEIVNTFKKSN